MKEEKARTHQTIMRKQQFLDNEIRLDGRSSEIEISHTLYRHNVDGQTHRTTCNANDVANDDDRDDDM